MWGSYQGRGKARAGMSRVRLGVPVTHALGRILQHPTHPRKMPEKPPRHSHTEIHSASKLHTLTTECPEPKAPSTEA